MRYIVIPAKQVLDSVVNRETKQPITYGLHDMLAEHCWGDPAWRDGGETSLKSFERCFTAFKDKKEGEVAELENADYEMLKPIATMKGKPIPPAFAVQFNRLMLPIIAAPTELPKSLGEADAGGNGKDESATATQAE